LVFPSRRKVIFVHGCFWHGHDCKKGRLPASRPEYWVPKITANRVRDAATEKSLSDNGWQVLTVWQCQIHSETDLADRLMTFLGP
jgi:DNA mismatch endonuclease (patch repair protein)